MFCSNCGNELPEGAKFCDACGAAVEAINENAGTPHPAEPEKVSEKEESTGRKVTENIVLGPDGKYHWYYEFKLMKNPTILKLLWKIFFWIFVVMWAFLSIVNACDGHFNFSDFIEFTEYFLFILIGVEVLVAVGYFIYAAVQGFKYCVMFEMDEDGIKHTQMQKQFKKAQAMSVITMIMGAAAGKPGVVGTSLLAATKSAMSSSWKAVKRIEIIRKHDVIKVNEQLNKNQVYALPEDFDFVEDFIKAHVPTKCAVKERLK